jgi:glucose-1-phosphate thymidylyltransferase
VEQRELRGQAHAISLIGESLSRPTLIIFGDTIFEADLTQLGRAGEDGTLFVQEVDDPRRFGIAVVGADGYALRLVEKPREFVGNLAVVGIYYIRDPRRLMSAIDQVIARDQQIGGEFYLADALQAMIDSGARFKVGMTPVWADCGTVEALLNTNRFLLNNGHSRAPVNGVESAIIPPVNVDPSAVIERSVIGPNVSIAAGAVIVDSIVQDSIVNEDARIEGAMLALSLIGSRAVVRGHRARVNVGDDSQVILE